MLHAPPSDGYTVFGDEEVVSKFGVMPSSLPDLFGLVGDVADNIPGEIFLHVGRVVVTSSVGLFLLFVLLHELCCSLQLAHLVVA